MSDIVGKLREGFPCLEGGSDHTCRVRDAASGCLCATAADTITALRAENEKLRAVLALYREAVRIDATMEGPKFMGSNASALKRAWDADCAALEEKP